MKVADVFEQAPTRLKETLGMARAILHDRLPRESMEQTNRKILASLRKLGFVTRADVKAIEERIVALESQVQRLQAGGSERRVSG